MTSLESGYGPSREALEKYDQRESAVFRLYRRKDMSESQQELLLDLLTQVSWDDAIHIAAPWDIRTTFCGNWDRNRVLLDGERPDGVSGCWTCLQAAGWFDKIAAPGLRAISTAPVRDEGLVETSGEGNDPGTGAAKEIHPDAFRSGD